MLPIFAQAGGGGAGGGPGGGIAGLSCCGLFLLILFGIMLVAILPHIFYLLTLQRALDRCSPRNRTQEPGMVWLALIPVVGLAWVFINVLRVSESLGNEYRDRRWHTRGEDYGHGVGIAYACLLIGCVIPYLNLLLGPAALVCWIIYWVKVANLSGQLEGAGPADYDDYDDEDDDRPRRRRRDDEEDDEDDRPRKRRRDDDDDFDDRRKPWDR